MARKPRVEIPGGLYHIISRGNDRRDIFHSRDDHQKLLELLAKQKAKTGFFLYAYCLMTNHLHLLIERQAETIGNIMQRVLTGYSQYYNRRYKHVGHVFQGRHKAILCESQTYLTKLIRYIHLNPVRARMVTSPEEYPYSSHRAYVDLDAPGIVDVDPVLRHFGSKREAAIGNFLEFMGMRITDDESFYSCAENNVLGSEEFVDAHIHRLGTTEVRPRKPNEPERAFAAGCLIQAVESVMGISGHEFSGPGKGKRLVMAKELLILVGRESGATVHELSEITGLDQSSVTRRCDAARQRVRSDAQMQYAKGAIEREYLENIAKSHV